MNAATVACPIRIKKGMEANLLKGFPWIYSEEIIDSSEAMLIEPGSLVSIENHKGQKLAIGYFNPRSQIAARVLTRSQEAIDEEFFRRKIAYALNARERVITAPFYRLVHAESDFLPGLLIDRFAEHVVVQSGTAGMEKLQNHWLAAIHGLLSPSSITLRNDTASRLREGLEQSTGVIHGTLPELVEVQENGCIYLADLLRGQKTGWFYDQRDNRKMMAEHSIDKTMLDVYSHSGGFGLLAAKMGASEVTLADSSKLALELASKAAACNGISGIKYEQGDAFEVMARLAAEGKNYDVVIADPPAFVKQKKDVAAGMKGYEKVARLAAALVKPGGKLFVASCSHHASRSKFNQVVMKGAKAAGFEGKILAQTGAAPDHPRHPQLPQSEYLKGVLIG